ncbi:MAG: mechanosensitive ion channel [Planctomycetes bacterium]|nr:mechanosensitive ion channel [Planctomycetota bacterium]
MRSIFLGLILISLPLATSGAQEPEAVSVASPAAVTPLPELRSPRATLHTFLRAMRDNETALAVSCLDLGRLTKEAAATSGPNVAYQLHVVIQRLTSLSLDDKWLWESLPDENDHPAPFDLDSLPGALPEAAELILRRNKDDSNWRFSEETSMGIEALYNALEQAPAAPTQQADLVEEIDQPFAIRLRNAFPVSFRNKTFILPNYQWLCLLSLIFVGLAADVFIRWLLALISSRWLENYVEEEEVAARAKIWRPIGRLVNASAWYWGTKLIGLPPSTIGVLLEVLKLFTIYAAAWTAFAIVDVLAKYLARQALRTDTKFDDLLVPLLSKSLKIFTACIAVLTAAQTFEVPILGLLGGLGLGGAALAFASKDSVANFFGSLTVLFDRPFEVGDWIVTAGAEGTVETVGFRSTRIRTFYNSLVTLPNSHLTTSAVDNMGRRQYRRIKTTLSTTPPPTNSKLFARAYVS